MKKYVIVKEKNGYQAYKKFLGLFYMPWFGRVKGTYCNDVTMCEARLIDILGRGIVVKEIDT